jgi:Fur family ferric uptake transcriptional regulator/Fur family peroxide stress response transcriptional regulator
MTKQRELILSIINASSEHLTAEQVYLKATGIMPKTVLATVYNNLNALVKGGMIKKINMPDGTSHYDKTIPHDHLVCIKCGKITDVMVDGAYKSEKLIKAYQNKTGEKIVGYDLILYHVCGDCEENQCN